MRVRSYGLVIAIAITALDGCAIPILSRKTVIDPEPMPVCKIEKAPEYKTPAPGPLDKRPEVKPAEAKP